MGAIGRNQRCPCGSGKKAKRCCGARRGPSEAELAKAFLSARSAEAAHRLVRLGPDEFRDRFNEMVELPGRHLGLQVALPRLLPPALEALRAVVAHDADASDELVSTAVALVDTPQRRAEFARAVLELANSGIVDRDVADVAIVDLDSQRTSAFMQMSLLHAVSVSVGASRTPSGLLVATR